MRFACHSGREIFSGTRCIMPVYTYRCENCGVEFDHRQSFQDPYLTVCPECGAKALRRVYKPVGIVFKGSGFYATDHRSPSGQTRNNSSKGNGTESKAEVKATSESKA